MATILQLPTETIIQVALELHTDSLCSLILSCRRMRNVVTSVMYRDIVLTNKNITRFLTSLATNPELALYVRILSLTWDTEPIPRHSQRVDDIFAQSHFSYSSREVDSSISRMLARKQSYLKQDFLIVLRAGSRTAKVLYLLTLLTNLHHLRLKMIGSPYVFKRHFSKLFLSGKYLRNLGIYEVHQEVIRPQEMMWGFKSANLLPSIQDMSFAAVQCDLWGTHRLQMEETILQLRYGSSDTDIASIWYRNLHEQMLEGCLRLPKAVGELRLSMTNPCGPFSQPFVAADIGQMLRFQIHSLKKIYIQFPHPLFSESVWSGDCNTTLGTFSGFMELEEFSAPIDLLLGRCPSDPPSLSSLLPPLRLLFLSTAQYELYSSPSKWTADVSANLLLSSLGKLAEKCHKLEKIGPNFYWNDGKKQDKFTVLIESAGFQPIDEP